MPLFQKLRSLLEQAEKALFPEPTSCDLSTMAKFQMAEVGLFRDYIVNAVFGFCVFWFTLRRKRQVKLNKFEVLRIE